MTIFSIFRPIATTLVKQINALRDFLIVLQVVTKRQHYRPIGDMLAPERGAQSGCLYYHRGVFILDAADCRAVSVDGFPQKKT